MAKNITQGIKSINTKLNVKFFSDYSNMVHHFEFLLLEYH